MASLTETSHNLSLTMAATNYVSSLLAEENNPQLNLRISISGGGCSGYQYDFTFDETTHDDDIVIENYTSEGSLIKLLVDSISYQYLEEATIDYQEGLNGGQFLINNPNAKTTCGCGSSFSMDDE